MTNLKIKDLSLDDAEDLNNELRTFIRETKAQMKLTQKQAKTEATTAADQHGREYTATKEAGDTIIVIYKDKAQNATIRTKPQQDDKTLKVTIIDEDNHPVNVAVKFNKVLTN